MALRRIRRDEARLGMYIHAFDGPWTQHPFWLPRFLLDKPEDLARLRDSGIDTLLIDEAKGLGSVAPGPAPVPATPPASPAPAAAARLPAARADAAFFPLRHADGERAEAARIVERSKQAMKSVFDRARLGEAVQSDAVVGLVEDIARSLGRDAQAIIGITRLKSKHEYTYLHSVAVCALMINLGRQLGFDEGRVRELGVGGLLHDIGKMAVPAAVLDKPGALSDDEFRVVRSHPVQGHAMLDGDPRIPAVARDICLHHHEKVDGTGYPYRLAGDAISVEARMGAICDVYDALTSNRAYKDAWTPVQAITAMHGWAGHFDPAMLFHFMRSVGVFPPGLLVRLRSNRLAITLDNGRRGSRPRVRAFYSAVERSALPVETVTITDSMADDQVIRPEDPADWGFDAWEALRDALTAGEGKAVARWFADRAERRAA